MNSSLPKTNALKPLTSAMGIQGETPLGVPIWNRGIRVNIMHKNKGNVMNILY
ncbi:hypothetical protein KVD91_00390 [Helicobacter pylori]|nr:hypothetical protein KVC59_00390 [Helicobacter pylori]WRE81361.1 hypothetical protein KVD91_00390 [Helicobacter pylori]